MIKKREREREFRTLYKYSHIQQPQEFVGKM